MFNIFGSEKKKEEPKKEEKKQEPVKNVDLGLTINRVIILSSNILTLIFLSFIEIYFKLQLDNNMSDTQLKLNKTDIELKAALETYRNGTGKKKDLAKQKATQLLKKKKMYESHLNTLSNTQFTVESAKISTDMMKDNMDVISTIKDVTIQQKSLMKDMNVDSVGDMMDEMRDMMEDQQEINEELARNYEVEIGDDELDGGKILL